MKIVNWIEQADGSFAWIIGDCALAIVHQVDGVWRTTWHGQRGKNLWSSVEFPSAHEACLASEKYWPPSNEYFAGWLESRNGGYFRKFGKRAVHVRKAEDGWYAVQTDGTLLGKGENVSWFTTAMEACLAVEKEAYTPQDADPFLDARDQWDWIKLKNKARANA
jgi:hypothetical protein